MLAHVEMFKSEVMHLIASGAFKNRNQLLGYIKSKGHAISRNGHDYVGILMNTGQRFRVKELQTLFVDKTCKSEIPEHVELADLVNEKPWRHNVFKDVHVAYVVYAIVAISKSGQKAAYVGSTANFQTRMRQHDRGNGRNRTSFDLKVWAKINQADLKAGICATFTCPQTMLLFEGTLSAMMLQEDWVLPGYERWAALRRKSQRALGNTNFSLQVRAAIPTLEHIATWETFPIKQAVQFPPAKHISHQS